MLTIPQIREEMRELARKMDTATITYPVASKRLRELSNALVRRSPRHRATQQSQPMTPELAEAIAAFAKAHPGMPQVRIARHFNVNPGRVSEALRGKRETA